MNGSFPGKSGYMRNASRSSTERSYLVQGRVDVPERAQRPRQRIARDVAVLRPVAQLVEVACAPRPAARDRLGPGEDPEDQARAAGSPS